jgi:peptidoglycan/xylan/chitin deacetylase (PgdA/CDA1 family)
MYITRTPGIVKPLLGDLTWSIPTSERVAYLTFDDGPTPGITPWVLDTLKAHGARGTFFCIGRNAMAHPALMARIRAEGHGVGNHTWDHASGWGTAQRAYLRSVLQCQALTGTSLFRPPYGRITRQQARALRGRFRIVMWELLSGDFDPAIDGARCLGNVAEHLRPGSIVVFHDSDKAADNLKHALPRALARWTAEGYRFEVLPGGR